MSAGLTVVVSRENLFLASLVSCGCTHSLADGLITLSLSSRILSLLPLSYKNHFDYIRLIQMIQDSFPINRSLI